MYAIDFEYDGQYLSDYGFIICDFNFSSGAVTVDSGSKITFEKVTRNNGKNYSLVNTTYEDCITGDFDICKNPDEYEGDDREITDNEYRDIMRWLNRREFLKFQAFDNNKEGEQCFFDVSFNVEKIKIGEKLYGLHLTMESNKPFGYGQEQKFSFNFSDSTDVKKIIDMSDEIGYIYPNMTITCNLSGTLSIYNELLDCRMIIKNCLKDEKITILGDPQIISTTRENHDICNDFNYEFFKIGNTFNNRENKISTSIPCEINIEYSPIIKNIP